MTNEMTTSDNKKSHIIGTPTYANWRAFLENKPSLGAYECLLYTDAWLLGELEVALEPYHFFNLLPTERRKGRVRAAVALRVSFHVDFQMPSPDEKTEQALYHGGGMADELAALASLKCGVRFRIAGLTREFAIEGDPKGRLRAHGNLPEPPLLIGDKRNVGGLSSSGFILDSVTGEHSMRPVKEIKTFATLSPQQAMDLVRAARLYQDALWTVEAEPNLAWLMLVSAIETAANSFYTTEESSLERLRASRPEFVKYLEDTRIKGLATKVADEFADSIGATNKFVKFLTTFLPQPPELRPKWEWGQVEWAKSNLKKVFRRIYSHRSRALHAGIPFPAPMCEPPSLHQVLDTAEEKPIGLSTGIGVNTWQAKDTPILFHTFEYITRNALNAWWDAMVTPSS